MIWLWMYLAIGAANCTEFAIRGGFTSKIEFFFCLLLWPVQVAFRALVLLNQGTSWVLERMWR